jgi:hypothetical protein
MTRVVSLVRVVAFIALLFTGGVSSEASSAFQNESSQASQASQQYVVRYQNKAWSLRLPTSDPRPTPLHTWHSRSSTRCQTIVMERGILRTCII